MPNRHHRFKIEMLNLVLIGRQCFGKVTEMALDNWQGFARPFIKLIVVKVFWGHYPIASIPFIRHFFHVTEIKFHLAIQYKF